MNRNRFPALQVVVLLLGLTLLLMLLRPTATVYNVDLARTTTPAFTGTPVPQNQIVVRYFRPADTTRDYMREQLDQAAAVLQARLVALGLSETSISVIPQNAIQVTMPLTANGDAILQVLLERGLIELFYLSERTSPSLRYSLIGQRIMEHYPIPFGGDIFAAAVVERDTPDNWSVIFELEPQIWDQRMDFAVDNREGFFAVVVDEVVVSIISIASSTVPGLSEAEARRLAALMQSGPLPFPLEHDLNDYPSGVSTSTPAAATSGDSYGG